MNNPRTAWIVYTVLRLLFFAVPFAVLFVLGIWPWLAAIFAALIGVSLSIIFLSRPRDTASESIYDWRNRERTPDSIVEDEAVEAGAALQSTEPDTSAETSAAHPDPRGDSSAPRESA
ncbi:uncharacterized protein DUF4229 [Leucobacter luti]|uniref:DUF4229 domain-containing protein n=1 Tax=Leucobacter luti TaxID=340320 RepID=UPI00104A834C|nr:DUF4229 domain-containing protein [Leucobacter luti]MCW2288979.1 hypothetical protein [Leucobacter luti]TCK44871.1 uncharacterized protein DUF4229 [Leucobacter luti]